MPFHWAISDSISSTGNQYCRNSAIISEYQDNKNLRNLSIAHTDNFSLPEILLKPKASLKAQLLFLMHFSSVWYGLFLPRCWGGGCSALSVMHCQYYMDQWWREGKLSLSLCSFSRTTLNSQHNCLRDYLCVCTELSWNKYIRHCLNLFSSSFPCRVYFFHMTAH